MRLTKNCFPFLIGCSAVAMLISCQARPLKDNSRNTPVDSILRPENNPYVSYDQSPMDMSYYPVNYPLLKMNKQDSLQLVARVIYSRPHKKNRTIFSKLSTSLCQYGREWRLGANEATEIEFFRNVTIGGKNVTKGSYVLYCIPEADKWTIALNTNLHTWGLHMDTSKDVLRTEIPVQQQSPPLEDFTMVFTDSPDGAGLLMSWDNVKAVLPIVFSK